MVSKIGQIEAVVDAIGESDNEIGGLNQTRLTATVASAAPAPDTFTWDGTSLVTSPREPTELSAGDWIRLDEDGTPFEIVSITWNGVTSVWDIVIDDTEATPPTTDINAWVALGLWDGTLVVVLPNWEDVTTGMWIGVIADGIWFQVVDSVVSGTTILNPWGLTVPTGALVSGGLINPVTSLIVNSVLVETTLNWPDSGKIVIEGVAYSYGSKTLDPPSFDELSHSVGNAAQIGLSKGHTEQATVTDLSRQINALDLTRRAMLVEYAESEDLNAIGRNMGVFRLPFLESDDIFREIIKALAYNPKGTIFGIELALTAMVGAGNFTITEDLINHPNTVFITLLGGPFTSDSFEGKAYLTGPESQAALSDVLIPIEADPVSRGSVHSVTWKDEDHLSDFRNQVPTAEQILEYIGDTGTTLWTYSNGVESSDVTQYPDEGIEITHVAGFTATYTHRARIMPESYASINCTMLLDSFGVLNAATSWTNQWTARIEDGSVRVGWGVYDFDASNFILVLTSSSPVSGARTIQLAKDVYHDVEVRKYGTDYVELYVNGYLYDRQPYSVFTSATPGHQIQFGIVATGSLNVIGRHRQFGFFARTTTDYWGARNTNGSVATGFPTRLDIGEVVADPGDIGNRMDIRGSGVVNAQGGNNNGSYEVESKISANVANLNGSAQEGGTVQGTLPLRFIADADGQKFVFPDDLGKTLVIPSSDQGNAGSYTIEFLLDDVTLAYLDSFATPIKQETTICEVVAATFVSEGGLGWRLDPKFITEASLEWELSDASSFLSSQVTLRQVLPIPAASGYARVLDVVYSNVLSAQILLNLAVKNELLQALPNLIFSYYPFYISDPLGFVRIFLDDVTAAGVIPEFLEEL